MNYNHELVCHIGKQIVDQSKLQNIRGYQFPFHGRTHTVITEAQLPQACADCQYFQIQDPLQPRRIELGNTLRYQDPKTGKIKPQLLYSKFHATVAEKTFPGWKRFHAREPIVISCQPATLEDANPPKKPQEDLSLELTWE